MFLSTTQRRTESNRISREESALVIRTSAAGGFSAEGETDKCKGINHIAIKGCIPIELGGGISGGAMLNVSWGKWQYEIGAEIFGQIKSLAKVCYTCDNDGCDIKGGFFGIEYKIGIRLCWGQCYEFPFEQGSVGI
jgi:hypothetical protein